MNDSQKYVVHPYLSLSIAIVFTSFASILIRLSYAPAFIIAFYRLGLAAVILAPVILLRFRKELGELLTFKQIMPLIIAGFFLSLHFAFWITSLNYTPIANSVLLVSTQPVFGMILARLFLKEKMNRYLIIAVILAVIGCLFISGGDFATSGNYLIGDILALAGALCGACYLLVGRWARQRAHIMPYVFLVYLSAAIFLIIFALGKKQNFTGYQNVDYLLFLMLAVFPTLLGHTMFNYAVKYLKTVIVNMAFIAEPIGASILAYIIFAEVPGGYFYIGGTLLLIGIYLSIRGSNR